MKSRTTGALSVLALAVVIALVSVSSRSFAAEAVYPVEKVRQSFARRVWTRMTGMWRAASANAENVRLRREVASLALVRADLDRLEAENARLRRALAYKAKRPEDWLAAGVLSENGGAAGHRRSLRVDKGSLDGVSVGAVVVVPEGLVGRVFEVTPHTSVVLLITDPHVKVSCQAEGCDDVRRSGVLVGGSEDLLTIRYLADADAIPARARVLTSGLGGVFPKGYEIGTYLGEGEVAPSVDFASLEDVFIRRAK